MPTRRVQFCSGCGIWDTDGVFGYVFHHIRVGVRLSMNSLMVLPDWVPRVGQMQVVGLSPSEMDDLVTGELFV